jgi:DNA adenine methylase
MMQLQIAGSKEQLPPKFRKAPFPYFGGKSKVTNDVWSRFGKVRHYIEPFCGSAAMLLGAPERASLEVINDRNFYIANFWRVIKYQPEACAREVDYPVSHVDLDARHRWLTDSDRTSMLREGLSDPDWPGDARVAGWWVWGQCCWIGSGWCEKTPTVSNAGRGVQSKIPHVSDAGRGVQSKIPHVSDAGRGVQQWFSALAERLERVRVVHGDWSRCLNHHYGKDKTAIFFDPPYLAFEKLYQSGSNQPVAREVEAWCRAHGDECHIALCGHVGDYDLPGWEVFGWDRGRMTYGGGKTKALEAIWFSPVCEKP